jgi:hypothetical protein
MTPNDPNPDEPDPTEDVDARFAEIVAGWETTAPQPDGSEGDSGVAPADDSVPADEQVDSGPADRERLQNLFRQAWGDDERAGHPPETDEHFVPPPAPPIPRPEPRRLLAWAGLVGGPMIALVLLLFGSLPAWSSFLLFCWFVGGFGYLVGTMRSPGGNDWDDGARI